MCFGLWSRRCLRGVYGIPYTLYPKTGHAAAFAFLSRIESQQPGTLSTPGVTLSSSVSVVP